MIDINKIKYAFAFLLIVITIDSGLADTLEFASGDGNPTGSGPVTSTTIRFRNNTDDPTGNTFTTYTPALNATLSISNQQYTNHPQDTDANSGTTNNPSTVIGWWFGNNTTDPIFNPMNWIGSPSNNDFTSNGAVTPGTGMDITQNHAVVIGSGPENLNGQPVDGRYQFYDLTINFNSPVTDPVLHFTGLGSSHNGYGYSTELDLLTTGVNLSKLSGSSAFSISGNQILNSAAQPSASGIGVGSGSVLMQGQNISSLTFRGYVRGESGVSGTNWGTGTSEDGWLLGISVLLKDFSDAPTTGTSYGDATHQLVGGIQLGAAIDGETASVANAIASGDGTDDDGVTIPSLIQGQSATITANVSGAGGYLQGWIDWNGNATFEAGEQVATDLQDNGTGDDTTAGDGNLTFNVNVPVGATTNQTFARFRWSTTSGLDMTTAANDGEVEDYHVTINPYVTPNTDVPSCSTSWYSVIDWATDAPTFANPLTSSTGNTFTKAGITTTVTVAPGTVPSGGNAFITTYSPSYGVDAGGNPIIEAQYVDFTFDFSRSVDQIRWYWTDFDNNESGTVYGELNGVRVTPSIADGPANTSTINKIVNADGSVTFERPSGQGGGTSDEATAVFIGFNTPVDKIVVSHTPRVLSNGSAYGGGSIGAGDLQVCADMGDAPDTGTGTGTNNYQTLASDNGALHIINGPIGLGTVIDNGDSNGFRDGIDDNGNASDDIGDDGVLVGGATLQGQSLAQGATITLDATTVGSGVLNAWIDWNADGNFSASEQVAQDIAPTANAISQSITVPVGATAGTTYARFRFSSDTGLTATDAANDGEVEDYALTVTGNNLPPFACDGRAYTVINTPSTLQEVDVQTLGINPLGTLNPAIRINGIGYNPLDDYIYGYFSNDAGVGSGIANKSILRLGSDRNLEDLGVPTGSFTFSPAAHLGTMDNAGNFYGMSANHLYTVPIGNSPASGSLTFTRTNLSGSTALPNDITFSITDNQLYGVSGGNLYQISTAGVMSIVATTGDALPNSAGGAWASTNGVLYFYNNGGGTLTAVDMTQSPPVATKVGDVDKNGQFDATACKRPNLQKDASVAQISPGGSFQYTYRLKNSFVASINVNFNDTLPAGLTYDLSSLSDSSPGGGSVTTFNATNLTVSSITLPSNVEVAFTVTVNVDASVPGLTDIDNQATLSYGSAVIPSDDPDTADIDDPTTVTTLAGQNLSGIVFEDINYGGGAGRDQTTSSGVGVNGATVELYDNTGTLVSTTTTANDGTNDGAYAFSNLVAGNYYIRVVSNTVSSTRNGSDGSELAVQTFRTDGTTPVTSEVGGRYPAQADGSSNSGGATLNDPANGDFTFLGGPMSGPAQSVTPITVAGADITGIDFGYNFDTIVNTNDSGQGSLRQFILNSNQLTDIPNQGINAGKESSIFMIPDGSGYAGTADHGALDLSTAGLFSLTPGSVLPAVIDSHTAIDGSTQNSAQCDPGAGGGRVLNIALDGSGLSGTESGLILQNSAYLIQGLTVGNFPGPGLDINTSADNGQIICNHIGLNASGTMAMPNSDNGILINGVSNTQVGNGSAPGRNVISGNAGNGSVLGDTGHGVRIENNADVVTLLDNYIGLDVSGTSAIPNAADGINVNSSTNIVVGNDTAAGRNVISGNTGQGIYALGNTVTIDIADNYIGTDHTGLNALGNNHGIYLNQTAGGHSIRNNVTSGQRGYGIILYYSPNNTVTGNIAGLDKDGLNVLGNARSGLWIAKTGVTSSTGNQIGGTTSAERNIFSGNGDYGVLVEDVPTGNTLTGNYMGTDISGNVAAPNTLGGVLIQDAPDTVLGGTGAGEGNVISGNTGVGVGVARVGATNVQIFGNLIGRNATNTAALGNGGSGVDVYDNAPDNTIGGRGAGEGNVIAHNGRNGVEVKAPGAITIVGNSLYANGQLGIDLDNDNVSLNDSNDADSGSNDLLNFPQISQIILVGTNLVVAGCAPAGATIDLYEADVSPTSTSGEAAGANQMGKLQDYGEGERHLITLIEGIGEDVTATPVDCATFVDIDSNNANGTSPFQWTLPIPAGIVTDDQITATSTRAGTGTSEFSPVASIASKGTLTGTVYIDSDGSNTQNNAEAGIGSITVELYSDNGTPYDTSDDNLIDSTTTDANGNYEFPDLEPGTYLVRTDLNDTDFPANLHSGTTHPLTGQTVTAGTVTTADFGFDLFICVPGGGTTDANITTYNSTEFDGNNIGSRAALDATDDNWRTAAGLPQSGLVVPWLGYTAGALSTNETALFSTNGVDVDVALVNITNTSSCPGNVHGSGGAQLSTSNTMQAGSPRPASLYNASGQPAFWNESSGNNSSPNAVRFTFATPVKAFGAWFGDMETRTDGMGEPAYLRLLDSGGNRIGADIAIEPTTIYAGGSTSSVDQNLCGSQATDIGCGNTTTRWVSFVDSAISARVKQVLVIVGDDDFGENGNVESLSFIGMDIIQQDRSDAPSGYGQAIHNQSTPLHLGALNDYETVSIANADASGDGVEDDGVRLNGSTLQDLESRKFF